MDVMVTPASDYKRYPCIDWQVTIGNDTTTRRTCTQAEVYNLANELKLGKAARWFYNGRQVTAKGFMQDICNVYVRILCRRPNKVSDLATNIREGLRGTAETNKSDY